MLYFPSGNHCYNLPFPENFEIITNCLKIILDLFVSQNVDVIGNAYQIRKLFFLASVTFFLPSDLDLF